MTRSSISNAALFLPVLLLLGGCSSLQGKVEDGVYSWRDGSFSVLVPHENGVLEYENPVIYERYGEGSNDYIGFGPSDHDRTIYRIETGAGPGADGDLERIATLAFEGHQEFAQETYGAPLEELSTQPDEIGGRRAYHRRLKQLAPAGTLASDQAVEVMHDVFVIDFGERAAVVAVEVFVPERHLVVRLPPVEPRAFAESLALHEG